jgi:hypothetical protein
MAQRQRQLRFGCIMVALPLGWISSDLLVFSVLFGRLFSPRMGGFRRTRPFVTLFVTFPDGHMLI